MSPDRSEVRMIVNERDIGLPGSIDRGFEEIYRVTSVGVVMYEGHLNRSQNHFLSYPNILLLEQLDQPEHPWGIPAGRVDFSDRTPYQTAIREVLEETGLIIDAQRLRLVALNEKRPGEGEKKVIRPVYIYRVHWKELDQLGQWRPESVPPDFGSILVLNKGNSFGLEPEIGRMALVDIQKLVHRMKKPHMTYPSYRSDLI